MEVRAKQVQTKLPASESRPLASWSFLIWGTFYSVVTLCCQSASEGEVRQAVCQWSRRHHSSSKRDKSGTCLSVLCAGTSRAGGYSLCWSPQRLQLPATTKRWQSGKIGHRGVKYIYEFSSSSSRKHPVRP